MPAWLSDPSPTFYILALVIALVAVGLWVRNRDRGSLVRAGVVVGLLLLIYVVDMLVESPREEAVRKVKEVSAAINERNAAKLLANVSDSFEFRGQSKVWKKADMGATVDLANQFRIQRTTAWDFNRDEVTTSPDGAGVVVGFDGKAEGPNGEPFVRHFKATFVKDPDGQYRLKTFDVYGYPAKAQKDTIPGL